MQVERSRAERKPRFRPFPAIILQNEPDSTRARAPKAHRPTCPAESRERRHPPQPSQKNRQKLPFASMLFLCQHSHYVSANSKPLLYLFRVYDIFYTLLFLIIFFCSLILDVPCLYHQPTAKLPISSFPPLVPPLLQPSHSRRASSPRRVFSDSPFSLPFFLLPRFINSIVLLIYHHPFVCRYNIIIGNIIPSLLMQLLFSIALPFAILFSLSLSLSPS